MTPDDEPKAATPSAQQREAARRALERERATGVDGNRSDPLPPWPDPVRPAAEASPPPGSGAPPPGEGDEVPSRSGGRAPLVLGIVAVVAIVVVAIVVLAGGSDDGDDEVVSDPTTTTTEATTSSTTEAPASSSTTEATTTTSSAPAVSLPPPAGAPMPTLDLDTDDIEQLAEQTSAFRQWLYANPDVAIAAQITAPGSQARQRLVDEIGRLEQDGRVAIFEGYDSVVDEATSDGDVASATWAELYTRYLVYEADTGELAIELPGVPLSGIGLAWERDEVGQWLLTELSGG